MADRGTRYDHEAAVAHSLYLADALTHLHVGELPYDRRPSRLQCGDLHSDKEKRKGTPRGEGVREGVYMSR